MKYSIVLYVPGMPFDGGTLARGQSLGGSETAGFYLARELARRGHQVQIFTGLQPHEGGTFDGVDYLPIGPVSERFPFGEIFMQQAGATPHDVLLGQRVPNLFQTRYASKLSLWWTHDLALHRFKQMVGRQLWNLDGICPVSAWHAAQIRRVYGLPEDYFHVLPNAVDPALFSPVAPEDKRAGKVLVFSSRPERGLRELVGGDGQPGIMELLHQRDPDLVLRVCTYDHPAPQMAPLYNALWQRCEALPNVELLGPLGKGALADLMSGAFLQVYPTAFEDTSWITGMEAQAGGTPVVAQPIAALTETLRDAGVAWVDPADAERTPDRKAFATEIMRLVHQPEAWDKLHRTALAAAPRFSWAASAEALEATIAALFARNTARKDTLARHFLRHSDIGAAEAVMMQATPEELASEEPWNVPTPPLLQRVGEELEAHYAFAESPEALAAHYQAIAQMHKARGNLHRQDDFAHHWAEPRLGLLWQRLDTLPSGAVVLDYGCTAGQQTLAMARRRPDCLFHGVDISPLNIEQATEGASRAKLSNVRFHTLKTWEEYFSGLTVGSLPLFAFCGEVLEHTVAPGVLADQVASWVRPGGEVMFTTPAGPHESARWHTALGREEPREHLHHLETRDLQDLFGGKPGFDFRVVGLQHSPEGDLLGNHCFWWQVGPENPPAGQIDMARKLAVQAPRQTLSVCIITRPDGETLGRALASVQAIADEIIVGVDCGDKAQGDRSARAWRVAQEAGAEVFGIVSPLIQGFDAARNDTIGRATGDWVLWIDDDETIEHPERILKYLRANPFDAYGVPHHHFSTDPPALLNTDKPTRLFRNRRGFQFFGVVHEHPELARVNAGPGEVMVLPDVGIDHRGYTTEDKRRERFRRNWPLMVRDRRTYPERHLGRSLMVRDLAQHIGFELERGRPMTGELAAQAGEALALWRGLLADGHHRLCVDMLPYVSECVRLLGTSFDLVFSVATGKDFAQHRPPVEPIAGTYASPEDALLLMRQLTEAQAAHLIDPYW